jgi:hypothetical protein
MAAAFRKGPQRNRLREGQNVMVDHHWLDGQYDRLPSLMADLLPPSRRRDCHTRLHGCRRGGPLSG